MTTINNYKVTLGLDASGLVRGATLARGQFQQIQRMFRDVQDPAEKLESKINLLDKAMNAIKAQKPTADLSHLDEVMRRLYIQYDNVTGAEKKRTDAMKAEENELQRLIGFEQQAEKSYDKTRTQVEKVEHEIRQLEHAMSQLKMAGQTSELQKYNDALERMYKQLDWVTGGEAKHLANMKSQEDELNRLIKLEQQAEDIFKKRMTATDIFAQERARLYELKRANLLTEEEYKAEVKLAKAKMMEANADKELAARRKEAIALIDRNTPKIDQLRSQYELLRKEYHSIAAASRVLGSEEDILRTKIVQTMRALRDQMNEINKSGGAAGSGGGNAGPWSLKGTLLRIGGFLAAKASFSSIANLSTEADKANISLRQTESILQAISGSDIQGSALINDIRQLTKTMPLSFKGAAEAAKSMMAYGFSSREVIPVIRQVGMITAGNSERFAALTNAIAQMRGANRLMGQEVIQAVNAGWNPLAEISRNTGKSMSVLKKEMEEGSISFDMVAKALETATSATGRFGGIADKIMDTVAGKAALLASKWEESMATMGRAIEPLSIAYKQFLTEALDKTSKLIESMSKLISYDLSKVGGAGKTGSLFSDMLTGDISFLNLVQSGIDISRFESMGGHRGSYFGQANNQANREDAIEKMSQQVELMQLVGEMKKNWVVSDRLSIENIAAYNKYLKRQTEEREKQNRIADRQAAIEKQRNAITAAQATAQEKIDEKFEKMTNKLKVRIEEMKQGEVAAQAMRADMAGFSETQIKAVRALAQEEQIEERKLKIAKEAVKENERMVELVQRYTKKTETVGERAARESKDIDKLLALKKITLEQAQQIKSRIIAEAADKLDSSNKSKKDLSLPAQLVRGSAEAVNAILSKTTEKDRIAMEQLKEQREQTKLQTKMKEALVNQPKIEAKRP